jgi:hypothetical protein
MDTKTKAVTGILIMAITLAGIVIAASAQEEGVKLASNEIDTPMLLMYLGIGITSVCMLLYVLARLKILSVSNPITVEDIFAGFMLGQIFFNFGIVLELSKLHAMV